jgi:hypothetical protein
MARTRRWCSRYAWLLGLIWGFAESTVFFIVPDVGVAFVGIVSPRDGLKAAVAAIIGALAGGTILFLAIHLWLGPHARQYLLFLPGIHPSTVALASARISDHGASALLIAAFQGIPYKVYATALTLDGISLPVLLFWTIPSRAFRLLPVAAAAGLGGRIFARSIETHFRLFVGAYAVFWTAFYVWYWTR